ncbi:MAG: hypothetical protein K0R38_5026, partial [Polyangiaceae bacterium]|nr:hypothetical protein [Polyangiaceae bacterium]
MAHVLGRRTDSSPVSRIPATPEELCLVAGLNPSAVTTSETEATVEDFLASIKAELAIPKRSLLRYCLYYREDPSWWGPGSDEEPYFFAMLWLTCLVAYGFPIGKQGDFHARLHAALDTKVSLQGNALGDLDDAWEDVEQWTRGRSHYRQLVLPPRCTHRTLIGRSHFLAFPHRFDRERLGQVLKDAGLAGYEPAIRLVLEALQAERSRFSTEFRSDLDVLFRDYLDQGRDPKDSPFWRAVRQAARDLPTSEAQSNRATGTAGLLVEWDADDLLAPFVAFSSDWVPPDEWLTEDLELAVGPFSRRATLDSEALSLLLKAPAGVINSNEARAVAEGFVPLVEEYSGLFRVAIADAIEGCEIALVRDDLVESIRNAFGGRSEESGVQGWAIVANARFRQLDSLIQGLSSVRTLLQTTDAPPPVLTGGIRASGNTFYAISQYMPKVRAEQATGVVVQPEGTTAAFPCSRNGGDDGLWTLPAAIIEGARLNAVDIAFEVTATYSVKLLERSIKRESKTRFHLQMPILATDHKGLPAGAFRVETCKAEGETVEGPQRQLGLGITSPKFEHALDMLPFDPTASWLGPGLGE